MNIDELDIKVLKENFGDDMIKNIDVNNVSKIYKYLEENNVYYAKDKLGCDASLIELMYED